MKISNVEVHKGWEGVTNIPNSILSSGTHGELDPPSFALCGLSDPHVKTSIGFDVCRGSY